LSPYFNATLGETWLPGTGDNSLGNLSAGTVKLGGVPFDVRGVIQLAGGETDRLGGRFAAAVDGIKVRRPFELLHLLHSASGKENDGVPVASLVLHYADGGQATVPIRYGETVRDWWFWEFERVRDPATAMATSCPTPPTMVPVRQGPIRSSRKARAWAWLRCCRC